MLVMYEGEPNTERLGWVNVRRDGGQWEEEGWGSEMGHVR
jgi:hypothetical protein